MSCKAVVSSNRLNYSQELRGQYLVQAAQTLNTSELVALIDDIICLDYKCIKMAEWFDRARRSISKTEKIRLSGSLDTGISKNHICNLLDRGKGDFVKLHSHWIAH